jgi:hypothetical protein
VRWCEELETGLSLLGATAVEDKLQVGGGGACRLLCSVHRCHVEKQQPSIIP